MMMMIGRVLWVSDGPGTIEVSVQIDLDTYQVRPVDEEKKVEETSKMAYGSDDTRDTVTNTQPAWTVWVDG